MNIKTITNYLSNTLFLKRKTEWFCWWVLKDDCKIQWIETKKLQSFGFLRNSSFSVFIKFLEQFNSYSSSEWYEVTPYFIYTITKGKNRDIPLDYWYIYHILLPKKAFKKEVTVVEDKKENSTLKFKSYFWLPLYLGIVAICIIIRANYEWSTSLTDFQEVILSTFWVSVVVVFVIFLVLLWFFWWKISSYFVNRWVISIDDIEFEKIFDIKSKDEIWVRTFFTPNRIIVFKDIIHKSWITRVLFKEKSLLIRFPTSKKVPTDESLVLSKSAINIFIQNVELESYISMHWIRDKDF